MRAISLSAPSWCSTTAAWPSGAHAALMAAGGLYARLVRIQAESLGWSISQRTAGA